ncbi:MAG: protein kinase [Acidobacteria bacterium]|nr:protein kinase [Acidobacteriota bacterium]
MREDDRGSDDSARGEDRDPVVGRRLGRYELLEFIGSGGMARVYKARDLVLGRTVAVKVLHGDDPSLGARFMNEARAQARVEHENICKVFEVGEEDGRRYIALQYIPGQALDVAAAQMSLDEKVRVLIQVAEAVQGAHRLGLIHRDLKPRNIMVDRSESGMWKPYVLDFGLVRDQAAPGLTSTGAILGTPAYMSPEQASGDWESIGPRADIYGLGVTFYELLIGRPPFGGTTYEILRSLMEAEPPSPRSIDPRIPADLNTIVMKCLEKDPSRRYESASALAEDLSRYLHGELISARPSTLRHRLIKKAGRHKAIVRVILAATALLAVAGAIGGYTFWKARKLVEYSQYFTQRAKEMESIMRQAYAQPLHDIRSDRRLVLNKITLVEEEIGRAGSLADGAGRYAMGRGFLVLREYQKAHAQLQRAWDSGCRDPEIGYCLGLALGELYKRALEEAQREASKTLREEKRKQAKAAYCDPALRYLKLSADVPGVAPAYVQGLIAFYNGRYEDAIAGARRAQTQAPWFVDSKRLEADALRWRGYTRSERGDLAGALSDCREAGDALTVLEGSLRSDSVTYEAEAGLWKTTIDIRSRSGECLPEDLDRMKSACEKAVQADPGDAKAFEYKASALWLYAQCRLGKGEDPREFLEASIASTRQALELDSTSRQSYSNLASAYLLLAQNEFFGGEEGRAHAEQAIAALQKAESLAPGNSAIQNLLATAFRILAEYELRDGDDPSASSDRSIASARKVIDADQGFSRGYYGLATAYDIKARAERERGRDPRPLLDQAVAAGEKALSLNPRLADGWALLGSDYAGTAECERTSGGDPRAFLEKSMTALRRCLQVNPSHLNGLLGLCGTLTSRARFELEQGRDAADLFREAQKYYNDSIAIDPRNPESLQAGAFLDVTAARFAAMQKRPAGRLFESAIGNARRAIEAAPNNPSLWLTLADVLRWKAEWDVAAAGAAGAAGTAGAAAGIQKGIEAAQRAAEAKSSMWEAVALSGALHLLQARIEHDGGRRARAWELGRQEIQQAIDHDHSLAHDYGRLLEQPAAPVH